MKLLLLSLLALSQGLAACAGHQVTDAGDVRPLTGSANIAPIPDPSPDRHFSRLTEDDFREVAEELGIEIEVDESIQAEERPAKRKNDKKREDKPAEETAAAAEEQAE